LQVEREERECRQQLEQARIDRLLDQAASLGRATDIRAYVDAAKTTVASEATTMSPDAIERWSIWAVCTENPIQVYRAIESANLA
jgi:hypothetical protein